MDEKTNVGVHIPFLNVEGREQKVDVVDPNHVSLLLNLNQVLRENLVYFAVSMPHFCILLIYLIFVIPFEVMEKWSQKLLIEKHEFFDLILFKPYWIAILALQQILNPNFFVFVFWYNSRPSNPLKVNKAFFL